MRRLPHALVGFAAALLLASGASSVRPASATFPGANGLLAVVTTAAEDERPSQVYAVPSAGGRKVSLSRSHLEDRSPVPSPDGRRIAFLRGRDLWLMRSDGTHQRRLASASGGYPVWSPDGTRIAYAWNGIWVVDLATGAQRRVTHLFEPADAIDGDSPPSWSRGGRELAFVYVDWSGRGGHPWLGIVAANAESQRLVTDAEGSVTFPVWSPRGSSIAFVSGTSLYSINPRGGAVHRLAPAVLRAQWSPNGRRLLLVSDDDGLDVVNADGSGRRTLGEAVAAVWSPAGDRIAIAPDNGIFVIRLATRAERRVSGASVDSLAWSRDGRIVFATGHIDGTPDGEIALLGAKGGRISALTRNLVDDDLPAWSPDGSQLAYVHAGAVWVMSADGARKRRLVKRGTEPSWSPDGTQIVFRRDHSLLVVDSLGSRARRLIADASNPAWSPDGGRIGFLRSNELWVATANGRGATRLTHEADSEDGCVAGVAGPPDWSPDGAWIVYTSGTSCDIRFVSTTIVVAAADGSAPTVVAEGSQPETEPALGPSWSPDGSEIAYWQDPAVRLVSPDGSNDRAIPTSDDRLSAPVWQPRCTVRGTRGADVLRGTPGDDVICGFGGDDEIRAGAGDDVVIGGDGNDTIIGGPGRDRLFGARGNDHLLARDGERDVIDGGPGRDHASRDSNDVTRSAERS